ncbi:MAG: hypothetical protein WDO71_09485 [Bacteroidota bacterium]
MYSWKMQVIYHFLLKEVDYFYIDIQYLLLMKQAILFAIYFTVAHHHFAGIPLANTNNHYQQNSFHDTSLTKIPVATGNAVGNNECNGFAGRV